MTDMGDESGPRVIGGRYETVRLIGRGGMGSVWLANDSLLGRQVAIKQIGAFPSETEREAARALREARSVAALNHPNVVALYDAITDEGAPWLVMEYVAGPTLSAWVREHGPMQPEAGAEVGARLASGLAAAHRAGIVHRDIKPANVFMADDGEPKIGDFGTARGLVDDHLTLAGVVTGTPGYMAPEVADGGEHAEAADVWALGATLYFAVEGTEAYPGAGNALATLRTVATQPPRPPLRAGALEQVLAQMLAHDPSRRGTMHDVMRRLEAIAPGRPGAIPMVGAGAGAGAGAVGAMAAAEDDETSPHFVSQEAEDAHEASGLFGFADAPEPKPHEGRSRRGALVAGLLAAVLVGGAGVAAITLGGEDREATPSTSTSSESSTESTTSSSSTSTSTTTSEPVAPPPEPTTEEPPEPTTEAPLPEPTSEPPPPPPEPTTEEPPEPTTEEPTPETTSEPPSPEPTTSDPPEPTTSDPPEPTTSDPPEPTTSDPPEPTTSDPPEPTTSDPPDPPEPTEPTTELTQPSGPGASSVPTPPGGAE